MTEITVPDEVAEQLTNIAQRQNLPHSEVLKIALERYAEDIEAEQESFLMNDPEVQAALKALRPKFYARARADWQQVGDEERLALTDEQLDEQFWLFDHDGIPRLKSDKGKFRILPNPLVKMAERAVTEDWNFGRTDISENFDNVLSELYAKQLKDRDAG